MVKVLFIGSIMLATASVKIGCCLFNSNQTPVLRLHQCNVFFRHQIKLFLSLKCLSWKSLKEKHHRYAIKRRRKKRLVRSKLL